MQWLYKLEKKFGKYAIPNLMLYILSLQAIVFLAVNLLGPNILNALIFDKDLILSGQVWRLITFIFVPDDFNPLWFILMLFIYYSISNQIERIIGSFNFNVFYFSSIIATILVCFIFDIRLLSLAYYINLSLFIAFATLMPNATFYLYFFIPFKAKYLLVFYFVILGMQMLTGGLPTIALICSSLLGYFIFFGYPALKHQSLRRKGLAGQKQFKAAKRELDKEQRAPIQVAFHKCHVCGKTELDDPDMEFRYCSKCNGNYEYCMDHLRNHEHIQ